MKTKTNRNATMVSISIIQGAHTLSNMIHEKNTYFSNLQDYTNIKDAINYLQGAAFSPVKSTLIQAIENGNFSSWPGFTASNVSKYYTRTIATSKGHMVQTRQNTISTQPKQQKSPTEEIDEATREDFAPKENSPQCTHEAYTTITDMHSKVYAYLTGRFSTTSSRGNIYMLILYENDANAMLAESMKSKADAEAVIAYTILYKQLTDYGIIPNFQIMDNKVSTSVTSFLKQQGISYQRVPPHIHRRKASERAIRILKAHFIAGIETTNAHFPMHLWCRLVHQATVTLNLLRNSRLNHKLSAYAQVFGPYDFNVTPLAPPGTRTGAQEKPKNEQLGTPMESPDGTSVRQ
jgi:hypothetical protein